MVSSSCPLEIAASTVFCSWPAGSVGGSDAAGDSAGEIPLELAGTGGQDGGRGVSGHLASMQQQVPSGKGSSQHFHGGHPLTSSSSSSSSSNENVRSIIIL